MQSSQAHVRADCFSCSESWPMCAARIHLISLLSGSRHLVALLMMEKHPYIGGQYGKQSWQVTMHFSLQAIVGKLPEEAFHQDCRACIVIRVRYTCPRFCPSLGPSQCFPLYQMQAQPGACVAHIAMLQWMLEVPMHQCFASNSPVGNGVHETILCRCCVRGAVGVPAFEVASCPKDCHDCTHAVVVMVLTTESLAAELVGGHNLASAVSCLYAAYHPQVWSGVQPLAFPHTAWRRTGWRKPKPTEPRLRPQSGLHTCFCKSSPLEAWDQKQ